jgi:hypothetical protein
MPGWGLVEAESLVPGVPNTFSPDAELPTLFLTFAAHLRPDDRDGILAFANRYGLLGLRSEWLRPDSDKYPELADQFVSVEYHLSWWHAVNDMRHAVCIYHAFVGQDLPELRRYFTRQAGEGGGPQRWYVRTPAGLPDLYSHPEPNPPPQWVTRVERESDAERLPVGEPMDFLETVDDIRTVAMYWLTQLCDKRIRMASGRVHRVGLGFGLQPGAGSGMAFVAKPLTLLSTMWCQFARCLSKLQLFRQCVCGKFFEVHRSKGGERKQFCSPACKIKGYRLRVDNAAKLKAAGKTPAQIAKQMETDTATVKKWLATAVKNAKG